jgi:hypothetical protein
MCRQSVGHDESAEPSLQHSSVKEALLLPATPCSLIFELLAKMPYLTFDINKEGRHLDQSSGSDVVHQ